MFNGLLATNAIIGILCLTAFAQVFSLATGKLFLYASIFLVLPWVVRYVTHKMKSKQALILCLNLNFILMACGFVFRFPVLEDYPLIPVLVGYFSVLGVCLFINSSKNMENIFEKINVYLKIPTLLVFIWVTVWAGTPRLNHPLHVPQWSTVIYIGCCLVISYLVKFKYARLSWIVYILPFVFIDSELHYDAYHYEAYIEAANAVLMGGVPLDNVFCQYGLGYLIYSLGFLVLPHTYVSAALITNIANAIMTCFYLLCLRRLVKKTDIFCYFGMLSVFLFYALPSVSMGKFPSLYAVRFLPYLIFLYALLSDKRWILRFSYVICVFWSFESLVFLMFAYSAIVFLKKISWREKWQVWISFVYEVGLIILAFLMGYFIFFNKLPRYDIYLASIGMYINPANNFKYFARNIEAMNLMWLLVSIGYNSLYFKRNSHAVIIVGLWCLMYYIGNSARDVFQINFMFCALVMTCWIHRVKYVRFLISAVFLMMLPEKIQILEFKKYPDMNNACYQADKEVMQCSWLTQSLCVKGENEEMRYLMKKWFVDTRYLLLFDLKKVEFFLENQKADLSMTFWEDNDYIPQFMQTFVERKKILQPGNKFIVNKRRRIKLSHMKHLNYLFQHHPMRCIDETRNFKVYQVLESSAMGDIIPDIWHNTRDDRLLFPTGRISYMGSPGMFSVPNKAITTVARHPFEILLGQHQEVFVSRFIFKPATYRFEMGEVREFTVFPKEFIMWGSRDGERWDILGNSRQLKPMSDNTYVLDIKPQRLHYLKMIILPHVDTSMLTYQGQAVIFDFDLVSVRN